MNLKLDEPNDIQIEGCTLKWKYFIYSKHRGNPTKDNCVWIIGFTEEVNCFKDSVYKRWTIFGGKIGWGIISGSGSLIPIGKNYYDEKLFFAKFIDRNNVNIWHGYPADYRRKKQDIPSAIFLKKWRYAEIITKSQMRKILGGMKCNL